MNSTSALALILPSLLFGCAATSAAPPPASASSPPAPVASNQGATTAAATTLPVSPSTGAVARGASADVSATPEGFVVFSASELKAYGARLAPKMSEKKSASESLGKFGNHSMLIGHREGSGEAELHENLVDFFVVQEGEARLVVGGTIDSGVVQSPGEIRGPSITGGITRNLRVGDIVHIPAKLPHQLFLEPGTKLTYFVIKVDALKP
jgi:mannose-6-phosphate isomerase-like protein (cupin superfamily)